MAIYVLSRLLGIRATANGKTCTTAVFRQVTKGFSYNNAESLTLTRILNETTRVGNVWKAPVKCVY